MSAPDAGASAPGADVILNSGSGTLDKAALADTITSFLAGRGIAARVQIAAGRELPAAVDRAAAGPAGIIVAGGGDGTIATVAQRIAGTDKALGVLPLGTFNYFARKLGLPQELPDALAVIAGGSITTVDVGEVNGHLFLNNSSLGLYPALITSREATYRRIGRSQVAAYLAVVLVLLKPPAAVNLTVMADSQHLSRRTPLLFIGVNAAQLRSLGIGGEECLERRQLTLYITRPLGALALARLAAQVLFRRLHHSEAFEAVCAAEIVVGLRRRRVRIALDGEVRQLETPLRYRMMRDALRVVIPLAAPPSG